VANNRTARRSFGRRVGVRRETLWVALASTLTTLASGTPVLLTGLSAATLALRPFTIIRNRGVMHLASDQISASESYMAHMGCAVVSDQALAIGVTAVPTPVTDRDSDLWFLYESLVSRELFGDATGFNDGAGVAKEYDSKGMRKVEEGQDLAFVLENEGAPFSGCNISKVGRMLIKLH